MSHSVCPKPRFFAMKNQAFRLHLSEETMINHLGIAYFMPFKQYKIVVCFNYVTNEKPKIIYLFGQHFVIFEEIWKTLRNGIMSSPYGLSCSLHTSTIRPYAQQTGTLSSSIHKRDKWLQGGDSHVLSSHYTLFARVCSSRTLLSPLVLSLTLEMPTTMAKGQTQPIHHFSRFIAFRF